jgi:hypothetical protein
MLQKRVNPSSPNAGSHAYLQLMTLEKQAHMKKSRMLQDKFTKGITNQAFLNALSGSSKSSTACTQVEHYVYSVNVSNTFTGELLGKEFHFSTPIEYKETARDTHLQMLQSLQTFLTSYRRDDIAGLVDRTLSTLSPSLPQLPYSIPVNCLMRSFATPTNIYSYTSADYPSCYVARMSPKCTENCLTDYSACNKIKEIFPGSIRCMDICDNETLITLTQKTAYADAGQESVSHIISCVRGAEPGYTTKLRQKISHEFTFSGTKSKLNNISIEERAIFLQLAVIEKEFPDFKITKGMDTECSVKMIHNTLPNNIALKLTTVVKNNQQVSFAICSHYAYQKNAVLHPFTCINGVLKHSSARRKNDNVESGLDVYTGGGRNVEFVGVKRLKETIGGAVNKPSYISRQGVKTSASVYYGTVKKDLNNSVGTLYKTVKRGVGSIARKTRHGVEDLKHSVDQRRLKNAAEKANEKHEKKRDEKSRRRANRRQEDKDRARRREEEDKKKLQDKAAKDKRREEDKTRKSQEKEARESTRAIIGACNCCDPEIQSSPTEIVVKNDENTSNQEGATIAKEVEALPETVASEELNNPSKVIVQEVEETGSIVEVDIVQNDNVNDSIVANKFLTPTEGIISVVETGFILHPTESSKRLESNMQLALDGVEELGLLDTC